jgi:hypothetical protein
MARCGMSRPGYCIARTSARRLRALARLGSARLHAHVDPIIGKCCDCDGPVRKAAVQALGQLEPHELASSAAAVDALIICMDGDAASYVRAEAVEVLSGLDRAGLSEEQATRIEKHLQGKCYARKAYEGKYNATCSP